MAPVTAVFNMIVNEIGSWVQWLNSWQLFGVSFLYYFMGFVIIGLLIDFIFG